jgi:hypothetical protein
MRSSSDAGRPHRLEIYTDRLRIEGTSALPYNRVTDIMNTADREFLTLDGGAVAPLLTPTQASGPNRGPTLLRRLEVRYVATTHSRGAQAGYGGIRPDPEDARRLLWLPRPVRVSCPAARAAGRRAPGHHGSGGPSLHPVDRRHGPPHRAPGRAGAAPCGDHRQSGLPRFDLSGLSRRPRGIIPTFWPRAKPIPPGVRAAPRGGARIAGAGGAPCGWKARRPGRDATLSSAPVPRRLTPSSADQPRSCAPTSRCRRPTILVRSFVTSSSLSVRSSAWNVSE